MLMIIIFSTIVDAVVSYNIDTKNAIVYSLPNLSRRSNYFGMTVAIRPRAAKSKSWAIQIGAPRANITGVGVNEPGSVYRCHLTGPCYETILSKNENSKAKKSYENKYVFTEKRDNAWIGVAMDIVHSNSEEMTAICGHRWTYQALSNPIGISTNNYLPVGICYLEKLNGNGSITTLLPLKNEGRAYFLINAHSGDYDWGVGLAGMSAHFSSSGLSLGAPTVYHTTGTILEYDINTLFRGGAPNVVDIKTVTKPSSYRTDYYAYNGYSVGSGRFFGDRQEWIVFGSPRAQKMHGSVYPVRFKSRGERSELIFHSSIVKGATYGEYFGASITTGDINKDGFDDLVVGAPLFARRHADQGRVYIFLGKRASFEHSTILEGSDANGRFGTCVNVVGDMDKDGYPDLIVGAPYEGRGVIYIYRGGLRGIDPMHSQKILATEIHSSLHGFGVSISRGVDLDENFYDDVIIGSYLSDQGVLLRTRPVVSLNPTISHPLFLDRKEPSFQITICLSYTGVTPPNEIVVDAALLVDEELNRATVGDTVVRRFPEVTVSYKKQHCENVTVTLDRKRLNGTFSIPIQLSLSNRLHYEENSTAPQMVWEKHSDDPKRLSPVLNIDTSKAKVIAEVAFAGECGLDNKCQPNITLNCSPSKVSLGKFVLGSSETMIYSVKVRNVGEPAHYLKLVIDVEGSSDITLRDSECSRYQRTVTCNLEKFEEGAEKVFEIIFGANYWSRVGLKTLSLSGRANSVGSNVAVCSDEFQITSDAIVGVYTSSSHAILPFTMPHLYNISHIYEVQKRGVSPVGEVTLKVSIPISFEKGFSFAEYKDTSQPSVQSEISDIEILSAGSTNVNEEIGLLMETSEPDTSSTANNTLYLNCSVQGLICQEITFPVQVNQVIELPIALNLTILDLHLKDKRAIEYSSNATIIVEDSAIVIEKPQAESTTCLFLAISSAEVDSYIVVLSIVAGGLVLTLIINGLCRKGFFKRQRKEDMEALKTQDLIEERFSIYGASADGRKFSSSSVTGQTFAIDS